MSSQKAKRKKLLRLVEDALESESDGSSDSCEDESRIPFKETITDVEPDDEPDVEQDEETNHDLFSNDSFRDDSDNSIYSDLSSVCSFSDEDLETDLKELFIANPSIPHSFLKSTLAVLKKYHPQLPLDPRTILKTDIDTHQVRSVHPGCYYHFGVLSGLENVLSKLAVVPNSLKLMINVDGLPIYKSTVSGLWPVLMSLAGFSNSIFLAGIYYGENKPALAEDFLADVITELSQLCSNGFSFMSKQYSVEVYSICCDTPARSFIKCVKGHSGYYGCDRCDQKGYYTQHRVTFPECTANKRTDDSFRTKVQPEHHHQSSPFERLEEIDMVAMFPVDYMHSVCKGTLFSLLDVLRSGPLPFKLSSSLLAEMSGCMFSLRSQIPSDFQRRPRSMQHLALWKATEFRLFGLYLAPIVLLKFVNTSYYNNFMCFTVLLRILCHPNHSQSLNGYAHDLATSFLEQVQLLYGDVFMSYNVHSLIHLVDDCLTYGHADLFSCFPFESFLHFVKKCVHSPNRPFAQVVRRVSEMGTSLGMLKDEVTVAITFEKEIVPSSPPDIAATHPIKYYQKVNLKGTVLKGRSSDGYVQTQDHQLIHMQYAADTPDGLFVIGRLYSLIEFDDYPLLSKVDVHYVGNRGSVVALPASHLLCKSMSLSYGNKRICLPILHTFNCFNTM